MANYEKKYEKKVKENEKYLNLFETWLRQNGLSQKTIKKHIENVSVYINDFLNYYEITDMKEGCTSIDEYLGDWFVRKCLWSTPSTIKSTAASIKKFYNCMKELNYVTKNAYDFLCEEIKENIEYWVSNVEDYNDIDW